MFISFLVKCFWITLYVKKWQHQTQEYRPHTILDGLYIFEPCRFWICLMMTNLKLCLKPWAIWEIAYVIRSCWPYWRPIHNAHWAINTQNTFRRNWAYYDTILYFGNTVKSTTAKTKTKTKARDQFNGRPIFNLEWFYLIHLFYWVLFTFHHRSK